MPVQDASLSPVVISLLKGVLYQEDDPGLWYWGDLDTHGFSILDRLREFAPQARSLLMDRETLMQHRDHWVQEGKPTRAELTRLTSEERELYDDLRWDRLAPALRLEQEFIRFPCLERALQALS